MIMQSIEFIKLRQKVIDAGYGEEIKFHETVFAPFDADEFFGEYMWVVLSAGMKNQIARLIESRIYEAWDKKLPTSSAFRHQGKVKAIDQVKDYKELYFKGWQDAPDKLAYLETLPWIGSITKYHLAKNLGMDIAKPDRHLVRIAAHYNESPQGLCESLSRETGYRIATVDLIIWRAANLGYI